jgi:hypothetical protein
LHPFKLHHNMSHKVDWVFYEFFNEGIEFAFVLSLTTCLDKQLFFFEGVWINNLIIAQVIFI